MFANNDEFVSKMMKLVLKMMNFVFKNGDFSKVFVRNSANKAGVSIQAAVTTTRFPGKYLRDCLCLQCVENDVTVAGTPICSVMVPAGGGNHDIEVIRDGRIPAVGNQDSALQYDTYTAGNTAVQWVGYTFSEYITNPPPQAELDSQGCP